MQTKHSPGVAAVALAAMVAIASVATLAGAARAQGLVRPGAGAAPAPLAVPEPAALNADWWDYMAPADPGLADRLAALLDRATAASAALPPELAARAAPAVERLRISLTALPAMLQAKPAAPPPAPRPAETYTTRAILELDRGVRNLQLDLDERKSAFTVAERALRQGQRKLDSDFAAYLASSDTGPEHVLTGLEVMATRAEIALTEAEQHLRRAETEALEVRIRDLTELRERGLSRIVPDPERTADQIRDMVAANQAQLEAQREELLRIRAERSSLASRPDTTKTAMELADLRITEAMIDEALLVSRIALFDTEIDWLTISAGGLDSAAVAAIDSRLAARLDGLKATESDIAEWVTVVQRVIATALRTPRDQVADGEQKTRAQLIDLAQSCVTKTMRLRGLLGDIRFGADVTANLLAKSAGWRGWLRTRIINPAAEAATAADGLFATSLFRIGEAPVTSYGLLRVALVLLVAVLLSRLLRYLLARVGARDPGKPSAGLYTLGRLLHYLLVAAGLVVGLSSIGLDFSQLALVAGALSIGIGFGLQSIVNNFVSGLMILFEQSLKVGDVVQLDSGVSGVVKEINVRSTLIATSDAVDIVVPNSEFIAGKVTNFTLREPFHRIHVPFGVAYGSDKEEVRRVIVEAANKLAFTHRSPGRDTDVWLVHFGDNSLDFELVVWVNPAAVTRPGAVRATYLWEIETALSKAGIEIPFPQRDVRLHVTPGALGGLAGPGSSAGS